MPRNPHPLTPLILPQLQLPSRNLLKPKPPIQLHPLRRSAQNALQAQLINLSQPLCEEQAADTLALVFWRDDEDVEFCGCQVFLMFRFRSLEGMDG